MWINFSYSSDGHDYWLSCNHFYDEKKIKYKCPHYLCYLWPQISWDFFSSSRHKRIRVHVNANKSEKERGLKGFCVRQAIKKEFLCATFHHYAICICAEWKSLSFLFQKYQKTTAVKISDLEITCKCLRLNLNIFSIYKLAH